MSEVERASEFIEERGFDDVNLYLDNDRAGQEAVEKFRERFEVVCDHSKSYLQHKDLNDLLLYQQASSVDLKKEMSRDFSK